MIFYTLIILAVANYYFYLKIKQNAYGELTKQQKIKRMAATFAATVLMLIPYLLGYELKELPFPWPFNSFSFLTVILFAVLYVIRWLRPAMLPPKRFLWILGIWAIVMAVTPLLQGR